LGLIEQALDPGQNGLAAPEEQAAVAASNGRAGTAIGADRQAVRRAPGAAARAWQRDDRLSDFRRGADGSVVLAWDSSDGVMGVSGSAIQALLTQSALLIAARTLAIARVADISS